MLCDLEYLKWTEWELEELFDLSIRLAKYEEVTSKQSNVEKNLRTGVV